MNDKEIGTQFITSFSAAVINFSAARSSSLFWHNSTKNICHFKVIFVFLMFVCVLYSYSEIPHTECFTVPYNYTSKFRILKNIHTML